MTPEQKALAGDNTKLVYSMVYRYTRLRPGHVDWDDTVSAGMEGLCRAAVEYKTVTYLPGKQVTFSTWACRLIIQSISNHRKKINKRGFRCAPDKVPCPLSTDVPHTPGTAITVRDTLVDRPDDTPTFEDKELHRRLELAVQSLPDRERAVIRELFYAGNDQRRTGRKLGKSKEWVRIIREKALATLREKV